MKKSKEYRTFDDAMKAILRADPKVVREEIAHETREHTAERKAKGEHKRGRKAAKQRPSVSARASSATDD